MNAAVFAETVRRHLSSVGYLVFVALIALVGLFAASFNKPASMWPTLVTLLAIVTGSALIGPEFSTGTLQLLVTKPIRRQVYLLSRAAGVLAVVCAAAIVAACAEALARIASGAEVPWRVIADASGGALIEALLTIALLALLGSLTRAYFNVAIYVLTQLAFSIAESILGAARVRGHAIGRYLQHHPSVERGLALVDDLFFPAAPPELQWLWALRVLATAAIALVLACLAFRRREVPYGSD